MSGSLPHNQEFLLPASNIFIALSVLAALLLNWLPWEGIWLALRPDFVALVMLYWCVYKPYRVGIGVAWVVGIFADVANASLFGQHALAYAVLAFGGIILHRRIQMLDLRQQTLQVFPVLLSAYAAYAAVHWQSHGYVAGEYFIGSVISALLWVPLSILLQALRRPRAEAEL